MCSRPSLPGRISTKAPKGMTRLTTPSYSLPTSASAVIPSIMRRASSAGPASTEAMVIVPSSSTLTVAPVFSISRMVLPPGPMTAPILLWLILTNSMRGAQRDSSGRASLRHSSMMAKTWARPSLARSRASLKMASCKPWILMSIWIAVIPSLVPATLRSMSPRKSSASRMSVSSSYSSPSLTKPTPVPHTAVLTGMPASIKAKEQPHTVAMELELLDSVMSDTNRIV